MERVFFAWIAGCALLLHAAVGHAEVLTFDSAAAWQSWQMPYGLVEIDDDERLRLVEFRKNINAVADAHLFSHSTQKRGVVSGGIWGAASNPADAAHIIDGDPDTYWKPDPDDLREDWSVDIDLGRAVLAREIRLIFPNREGARPFRQFTVYATTGARIKAIDDVFRFRPVFRTTLPNSETSIAIPLEYSGTDSTLVIDEGLDVDAAFESRYQVVQYISIVVEEKSPDAALAEVEVLAVGDNVSLGTLERGAFVNGTVVGTPQNLFDADMNTFGLVTSGHESEAGGEAFWEEAGTWWGVDLGASFFIDDLFFYFQNRDEGVSGFVWFYSSAGPGYRILYSDGERNIGSALPVPEAFDYDELLTHIDPRSDGLFQIRYLFKPRKIRYLFWHGTTPLNWREARTMEMMMFSPGYPARVTLTSDFIDLGKLGGDDRPKVIRNLAWDADLPPGARLQLRSHSGSELQEVYTFYDKKGDAITEAKWNSLPKVVKGPVDTAVVIGADWGEWSNVYQFSGESFKSESPRRFIQLELILSTDDPEVAPVVNALYVEYEDALLQEARGQIEPRQAAPSEDIRFTYTLWSRADSGNSGFDLMRFTIPNMAGAEEVAVRAGGEEVEPLEISTSGDSLQILLPEKVKGDSLQVSFTTRIFRNATVFSLDLGDSQHPGLWQSVEPTERRANIVMLPTLTGSSRLIGDLRLSSQVLTPNGDGIHDRIEMRFVVYKLTHTEPRVQIYDVSGRRVAELKQAGAASTHQTFAWSGRDFSGQLVRPGMYLIRVDLGAESGEDTVLRVLAVAY